MISFSSLKISQNLALTLHEFIVQMSLFFGYSDQFLKSVSPRRLSQDRAMKFVVLFVVFAFVSLSGEIADLSIKQSSEFYYSEGGSFSLLQRIKDIESGTTSTEPSTTTQKGSGYAVETDVSEFGYNFSELV